MNNFDPTPAIVQAASNPAAELRAAFATFQEFGQKRLEQAFVIGRILSEQKKACGHGNWLSWLADNFPYGRQRAADFIRVHLERGKCSRATTFEEALTLLSPPDPEPEPVAGFVAVEPEPAEGSEDFDIHNPLSVGEMAERVGNLPDIEELPGDIDTNEYDLTDAGDDEPQTPEQPAAPPTPAPSAPDYPARRPEWMTGGGKVDPDHPFADVLKSMTALTKAMNKAIATDETGKLREYLSYLSKFQFKVLMVAHTGAAFKDGKSIPPMAKFVGLHPLRGIVRLAGKDKRKRTSEQVVKEFSEAAGANPQDILAQEDGE